MAAYRICAPVSCFQKGWSKNFIQLSAKTGRVSDSGLIDKVYLSIIKKNIYFGGWVTSREQCYLHTLYIHKTKDFKRFIYLV